MDDVFSWAYIFVIHLLNIVPQKIVKISYLKLIEERYTDIMKRIAINGFGRIGSAFFDLCEEEKDIEVVAINDLMEIENAVYAIKYDTVRGVFDGEVKVEDKNTLSVNGRKIKWYSEKDPTLLPWGEEKIDVVLESTGVFNSYDKAHAHIDAGAKKVLISAPVKSSPSDVNKGKMILLGVNQGDAGTCDIISNASCTTNSISILLKILDKSIGVEKAILNTVHAYTASQKVVDGTSKKDFRLGRSAACNIIPATTGAAKATTEVIKQLEGKFDGISLRVPVISGSIADVTFISKRDTTTEEINTILKEECKKPMYKGLIKTTEDPVVSSDIIGQRYVSIMDLSLTRVVDGNLVKVMSWYDNEMGYANSLVRHVMRI